jgi:hypothetical protein
MSRKTDRDRLSQTIPCYPKKPGLIAISTFRSPSRPYIVPC